MSGLHAGRNKKGTGQKGGTSLQKQLSISSFLKVLEDSSAYISLVLT